MPSRPPGLYAKPKSKPWERQSAASAQRIRGRRGQQIRAAHLAGEPLCRECLKHGRVTEAVIVDHALSLAEGGEDVPDNRQSLCKACSDAKTAQEAARGRRRAQRPA
ncbi:HNH endonuclease signature motif containing protein [Sphingomonas fennica]|uniref:Endonuclease n=1 Tax=Edaphosphingomonas fennica TaxID=114404 RepID=A0A2T4HVS2_9SPHN|nr:HNH endonuclease signature motif containing protein [Sphingomonas fennica]PTD19913.1 endonuclease [Sphingomonas fennica]